LQNLPWGAFFRGSGVYLLQPFVVGEALQRVALFLQPVEDFVRG
jgi:hypothetical protein